MNQRKSLSQALFTADLPPEAMAVIREGGTQPVRETTPTPKTLAHRPEETPVRPVTSQPLPSPDIRFEAPSDELPPRGVVTLSVRVQASLADALLRIAFARKLQRKAPQSQQDIVVQAVTQWIRKNGYSLEEP